MVKAGAEVPARIKTVDGWRYSSGIRVSVARCRFWLTAWRANSGRSFKPVPSEGVSAPSAAHLGIAGARSKASWEFKCFWKQLVWDTSCIFNMLYYAKCQSLSLQVPSIFVQSPTFKIQKIEFVTSHIMWHVHWLTCMAEISIFTLRCVSI